MLFYFVFLAIETSLKKPLPPFPTNLGGIKFFQAARGGFFQSINQFSPFVFISLLTFFLYYFHHLYSFSLLVFSIYCFSLRIFLLYTPSPPISKKRQRLLESVQSLTSKKISRVFLRKHFQIPNILFFYILLDLVFFDSLGMV